MKFEIKNETNEAVKLKNNLNLIVDKDSIKMIRINNEHCELIGFVENQGDCDVNKAVIDLEFADSKGERHPFWFDIGPIPKQSKIPFAKKCWSTPYYVWFINSKCVEATIKEKTI